MNLEASGVDASIDLEPAFDLLNESGYNGCWSVESCPRDEDELRGARLTIEMIKRWDIMILGTKGGIVASNPKEFTFYEGDTLEKAVPHQVDCKDRPGGNDQAYRDLIDAMRGGDADFGTTPEQALVITRLTEAAYRSADEGREIKM